MHSKGDWGGPFERLFPQQCHQISCLAEWFVWGLSASFSGFRGQRSFCSDAERNDSVWMCEEGEKMLPPCSVWRATAWERKNRAMPEEIPHTTEAFLSFSFGSLSTITGGDKASPLLPLLTCSGQSLLKCLVQLIVQYLTLWKRCNDTFRETNAEDCRLLS